MTMISEEEVKCGVCGHRFSCERLMSTSAFDSPDLDFRPSPLQRYTMWVWIEKCPRCGYVADNIETRRRWIRFFLRSEKYRTCEGNTFAGELASDFYKHGLISLRYNDNVSAYYAFLNAAWDCDDEKDGAGAVICRKKAISLWSDALFDGDPTARLRQVDLLRRVGCFAEAIGLCDPDAFEEGRMRQIALFQKQLAEKRDTKCYRIDDCIQKPENGDKPVVKRKIRFRSGTPKA